MKYRYIYKISGRYVLKKVSYGQCITYGSYESMDDAIKQRKKLIRHGWIKNKTTGYDKAESFPKYQIRKDVTGEYVIINKKDGKTYGSYPSKKLAKIIKRILPFYREKVDIKQIEKQAIKEFYKHITYNRLLNRFHVQYQSTIVSTHRNLIDALYERDLVVRYNNDEELMCENTFYIYSYKESELPPFPHYVENITYESRRKNPYKLRKQIRNNRITIGYYQSYELALLISDYLSDNDWKKEDIDYIINVTKNIQNRDKHIQKHSNKYYINRTIKKKSRIYAGYYDIELARHVRNRLMEDNWDINKIKDYEREFHENKISTTYYYDSSDMFRA